MYYNLRCQTRIHSLALTNFSRIKYIYYYMYITRTPQWCTFFLNCFFKKRTYILCDTKICSKSQEFEKLVKTVEHELYPCSDCQSLLCAPSMEPWWPKYAFHNFSFGDAAAVLANEAEVAFMLSRGVRENIYYKFLIMHKIVV